MSNSKEETKSTEDYVVEFIKALKAVDDLEQLTMYYDKLRKTVGA